jgi:CheY-like chemotaxis protein
MATRVRILLIEDSKFLRIATERALVRAGYVVRTASDGEQALQIAQSEPLDLILLDMLLPKMSGHDVLKALKKDAATANIPVVVLSGLSDKNAARLEADGACAFLEKSSLAMDKDSTKLLTALRTIITRLEHASSKHIGTSAEASAIR